MVKPFLTAIACVISVSGCTLGLQTAASQQERARSLAISYLERHRVQVPRDAIFVVTLSEAILELQPSRPVYIVDVKVPRGKKRETLYSLDVDPRRWEVDGFTDTRTLTPATR